MRNLRHKGRCGKTGLLCAEFKHCDCNWMIAMESGTIVVMVDSHMPAENSNSNNKPPVLPTLATLTLIYKTAVKKPAFVTCQGRAKH